ncbi:MAG: glycoside hydrolase [Candidatus Marinimicrobia bacterium]|nr:glycoside hydrolase [Candidatus Neomarinimicrobiota bacterium]
MYNLEIVKISNDNLYKRNEIKFHFINEELQTLKKNKKLILLLFLPINFIFSQIGDLIWEENFNDLDNWIKITGNGSWGWGNGELQYYKEENVSISPIPSEPNNNALHIFAKNETGQEITDQWGNPLNYTSGKVISKSNISVQYGVIESRVSIPDLDLGGWPAIWLLGTSNYAWPRNGEIDMMEMGSRQSFRDLHDEHNGGNGLNNSNVNQVVGANAIFYSDDAVTPDNPSGAASISWDPDDDDCRPYYNYENPLNDRFVIYRIYWDDESIRFTVIDNEIEYDLYTEPMQINDESNEFLKPFYLIANLAIGGLFTDANYIGGNGLPISMTMPASMYVDYIKVFEWNNKGNVHLGPPNVEGESLGLFTDNTSIYNSLVPEVDSHIYVWEGTLTDGSIPPFEGENGISWSTTGAGWFGAGIMSIQPVNMSNYEEGFLNFRIKIPSNVSFQVGIIDTWGNQSYVNFPSNQLTYGLSRNSEWGQASIPISDIRGELIDLRMLSYQFVILETNGTNCEFALDDIYWDGGTIEDLLGDLNQDNHIDILDVIILVGIITEYNGYNSVADFNSDGSIDVMDVVLMIELILG